MKYVYLVSTSAEYEDHRHCQCHVLGAFRTWKSAMRHFDMVRQARLDHRLFVREYWCIKEKGMAPRDMPNVEMAKCMHEFYVADNTTTRLNEQITLTRWALSPQRKKQ